MKKIIFTFFFGLLFSNIAFADSYYFKDCKLSEELSGNYIIDIKNNLIKVRIVRSDGVTQELTDTIEIISKNKIISEKVQHKTHKDFYFQYYLDVKSK